MRVAQGLYDLLGHVTPDRVRAWVFYLAALLWLVVVVKLDGTARDLAAVACWAVMVAAYVKRRPPPPPMVPATI